MAPYREFKLIDAVMTACTVAGIVTTLIVGTQLKLGWIKYSLFAIAGVPLGWLIGFAIIAGLNFAARLFSRRK